MMSAPSLAWELTVPVYVDHTSNSDQNDGTLHNLGVIWRRDVRDGVYDELGIFRNSHNHTTVVAGKGRRYMVGPDRYVQGAIGISTGYRQEDLGTCIPYSNSKDVCAFGYIGVGKNLSETVSIEASFIGKSAIAISLVGKF